MICMIEEDTMLKTRRPKLDMYYASVFPGVFS